MTRTHNFIILAFVLVSHKTFWSGCFAPVACCGRGGATVPLSLTLVTPLTRLSQATPPLALFADVVATDPAPDGRAL